MSFARVRIAAVAALALSVLAAPAASWAQECQGSKPKGGKWVTSAELYLDRARRNTKPEDKIRNYRSAVEILEEGFVDQPENPRNYLMAGMAHVGLRNYTAADSVWTRAEAMWSCYDGAVDTARYDAYVQAFNRGVRYSNSGDTEKAMEEYRNAWLVYDKLPQPKIQLGMYYAQQAMNAPTTEEQGEARAEAITAFREALAAIERSTRLPPAARTETHRNTTFNLAQLLAFEERYDEAVEAYEAFLSAEPDNVTAKSNMAVVATLAADQAADQAETLEDGPQKQALMEKADGLMAMAEQHYADLLARDDLEADDYHNIGSGLSRLDKTDDAVLAFHKALDLEPYRANSLEQLALAYYAKQQYDTLLAVAETLVERYPLNLNNLAILANAYRELERSEEALVILERREALEMEVVDLSMTPAEGVYIVTGDLYNIKLAPGTPVELQFDFYDDAGEVAASANVTVTAAQQGTETPIEVTAESSMLVSGYTYRLASPESGT